MLNRDEYFFDLCREAGFFVDDPADWAAMAVFAREVRVQESAEYQRLTNKSTNDTILA